MNLPAPNRRVGTNADAKIADDVRSLIRSAPSPYRVRPRTRELPFEVRAVRTREQLEAVVSFRFGAYRKHRPVVAEEMRTPEEGDLDPNSVVLYAKDKQSGEIVGSVRIESNFGGRHALADHLHLPEQIDGKPVAYITRLAVAHGPTGRLAKLGLFKAIYQYCLGLQIDYLTAAAPVPLDRQYASLGFSPIYPNARLFPGFTDPSI